MTTPITFTIAFEDGRSKSVTFERRRLKLKTLRRLQEVQRRIEEGNEWASLIPFIATLLNLTEEEADEIEIGDWEAIIGAMQQRAAPVPNESAPPSE